MSREDERQLSTADFAAAGERPAEVPIATEARERSLEPQRDQQLAELFLAPVADDFRRRWDEIQIGFVDDPRRAVQRADELVAEVMKTLAQTFAEQRGRIESGIGGDAQADTENLRVGLQRYRSFFQRLLSL
jgi:hypothetical protein